MQNDDDLRVQRTRKALQEALFSLSIEKGFADVTVRDIAKRAQVNRSTFYRHYLDKNDLLAHHFKALQAEITQAAGTSDMHKSEGIPAGLLLLLKHIQQHADFYRVMLGKNGDAGFAHRLRQMTEARYQYLFSLNTRDNNAGSPPDSFRMSYIAHATLGAILWWLESGLSTSPEQLAGWLRDLNMANAGFKVHSER